VFYSYARKKRVFSEKIDNVELLARIESTNFAFASNAETQLLSIFAVQPMSIEAVREFVDKSGNTLDLIEKFMDRQIVNRVEYSGRPYLIRNLKARL
jgi:wyosine [tRNA(Phe)-imidazoG37] synthetase (radical SAM superfamily)